MFKWVFKIMPQFTHSKVPLKQDNFVMSGNYNPYTKRENLPWPCFSNICMGVLLTGQEVMGRF
jgi:hypothetical protein